jgi:dolichol kinase
MRVGAEIAVVAAWIAVLAGLQSTLGRLARNGRIEEFTARKAAHVATGLLILPLAFLVRRWQVAAVPITMVLAANARANLTRAHLGRRLERWFPLLACAAPVAVILVFWARHRSDLVVLAVLAMTIGDTAAALVGMRFGRHKVAWTGKSLEGAAANVVTSFATLWIAGTALYGAPGAVFILPAIAAAAVEAALPGEWDNPVTIVVVMGLLAVSL